MAYGNPGAQSSSAQILANLASYLERGIGAEIVNHYNVQPVFDIYANVERQDLGSVGVRWKKSLPTASKASYRKAAPSKSADRFNHGDVVLPAGPRPHLRNYPRLLS